MFALSLTLPYIMYMLLFRRIDLYTIVLLITFSIGVVVSNIRNCHDDILCKLEEISSQLTHRLADNDLSTDAFRTLSDPSTWIFAKGALQTAVEKKNEHVVLPETLVTAAECVEALL